MFIQKSQEKKFYRPFVLVILDGFGLAPSGPGNAVRLANLPFINGIFSSFPYTTIRAAGEAVGLFPDADGNSEAGHINLGAGRIVPQDLTAVSDMIHNGTFYKNAAFLTALKHVKKNKSNLHLIGLLTGKNSAHSYPEHLDALLKLARDNRIDQVYLHLFTDGRDAPPYDGYKYAKLLLDKLDNKHEKIATLMGRFYAMDRKKEWSRTEVAYRALTEGSKRTAASPLSGIENGYGRGESDEFIKPTTIMANGKMLPRLSDHDAVIFFNARSDRARQLTKTFVQENFNELNPGAFKCKKKLRDIVFVALTDFGPDLPNILTVYPSPDLKATLPMELHDLRQLYIAENDKYAHMTYFFNGGYANPVGGEHRILVNSPDVKSYDLAPAMSAGAITDLIIRHINKQLYDFIAVNYANPDMLGHTGNLTAAIKALEYLDQCLKKIKTEIVDKNNGLLIVTADHGNVEEMIDPLTGNPDTEHSKNPVPFCIIGPDALVKKMKLNQGGRLADVAPTILYLLKRDKPEEMTGESLVIQK